MKKLVAIVISFYVMFSCSSVEGWGQDIPPVTEQQLENLTDADQAETEDDSFLQQLEQYRKNPINLNYAEAGELKELSILTDLQIANLISYRSLFGAFIDIYELQAIPTCDIATLRKLLPFVTIGSALSFKDDFSNRFKKGDHSMIFRFTQIMEKAKGFSAPATTGRYLGSPARLFFRYRYSYKNLLQYGLTGDKDAGEQFFKGEQKKGFDFYSFHLFARDMNYIKTIALGDFTINMGQGLIQWQSLAFKKSAETMGIKRQSAVLRSYNSAGEFNFNRGAGISLKNGQIETTAFISVRTLSANLVNDTVGSGTYISSFQTSGYHRTEAEIADKKKLQQTSAGVNIKYVASGWHVGINGVYYKFSQPIKKRDEPYNLFAMSGNNWYNVSVDYSYTYKNFHFFGEMAGDKNFNRALLNGLLISVDARVDVSVVHRSLAPQYQAINGNAFTENVSPTNEKGFYTGISIRPASGWRLDAYTDIYKFPWLRNLADAPGYGKDFLVQLTYTPNRQVELYTRFKNESKQSNQTDNTTVMNYLIYTPKQNWRLQINYKISPAIILRNRVEAVWYDKKGNNAETGFLTFFDFVFKPLMKPFSCVLRLQYFETGGYNSRLYAYENDVLYNYSIPVIFNKGDRYYITLNYDMTKKISCWLRWAQTIYRSKTLIGSGLDEIVGNSKTEIKLQARYLF